MRGLQGISSLFRNEFKKFINMGARTLDYIYRMSLKVLKNLILGVKNSTFCHIVRNLLIGVITLRTNL